MQTAGFLVYQLGLFLYQLLLILASPFHKRAAAMVNGRWGWHAHMKARFIDEHRKRIWYHCASLGEFEQIRPLLEKLKEKHSEYAVVLTFFSPSGYEQRKKYAGADYVFYLPFDTAHNANKFVEIINPEKVFFAKYDIWFHFLNTLKKRNIPVYLISAQFRENQVYFRWYGVFFRKMLDSFAIIFSQYESSTQLLLKAGLKNVITSGDTRIDNVIQRALASIEVPYIDTFKHNQPLIVLGSSYKFEERLMAEANKITLGYKIVVAPHHVQEARIEEIESIFSNFKVVRYSQIMDDSVANAEVLIMDNIGMLNNLYAYADVAFIGGGFTKGGIHNILEPLSQGAMVIIGPKNHKKFPETIVAQNEGVCFTVDTSTDLSRILLQEHDWTSIKIKCRDFISKRKGATKLILDKLDG